MEGIPIQISPLNARDISFSALKEMHLLEPVGYCHHYIE